MRREVSPREPRPGAPGGRACGGCAFWRGWTRGDTPGWCVRWGGMMTRDAGDEACGGWRTRAAGERPDGRGADAGKAAHAGAPSAPKPVCGVNLFDL